MDKIDIQVTQTIEKFRLLEGGEEVLVALSGGPDSVALLQLLNRLKNKYDIKLAAAHLDHGIREESSEDRDFCRLLCRTLKVKFHSRKININALATRKKLSIEEAGREARYDYLNALAEKYGYDRIATGHTSDDNVETIIFNLARGSGLYGLSGIPPKRGRIIRPLIETAKKDILRWLNANDIDYRIDRTNRSLKYARNRIRARIVPQLARLNPSASENILRLARNIGEEVEFIDSITVSAYEKCLVKAGNSKIVLDLGKIKSYDVKLRDKVVIEAYRRLVEKCYRPSRKILSGVMAVFDGKSGARSPLGSGIWIEKSKYHISIFKKRIHGGQVKLKIPGTTEIPFSDLFLECEVLERREIRRLKGEPTQALLDRASVIDGTIRFWKNGDRIRPFGMRGRRLLSNIFSERGIPSYERHEIPLLTSKEKIAWIAGVMISDDFKVGPNTRKILSLRLCGHS